MLDAGILIERISANRLDRSVENWHTLGSQISHGVLDLNAKHASGETRIRRGGGARLFLSLPLRDAVLPERPGQSLEAHADSLAQQLAPELEEGGDGRGEVCARVDVVPCRGV